MNSDWHSGVRLEPFDRRSAETILGWITSPDELFHWSAREGFPLTNASVFDEWHSDPEVAPYVLRKEDEIVADGEAWLDEAEESAELGRLIVSPPHRRLGFGRLLIERLASVAHEAGYQQIWVRVVPTNTASLLRVGGFHPSLGRAASGTQRCSANAVHLAGTMIYRDESRKRSLHDP